VEIFSVAKIFFRARVLGVPTPSALPFSDEAMRKSHRHRLLEIWINFSEIFLKDMEIVGLDKIDVF
jgi:hypothetical protein